VVESAPAPISTDLWALGPPPSRATLKVGEEGLAADGIMNSTMNETRNYKANNTGWTTAFEAAYRLPIAAVVRELVDLLGSKAVARLGGVRTTRAIYQWLSGEREPERRDALRFAVQLSSALRASGESNEAIRAWFSGVNPRLRDEAPLELLAREPHESRQSITTAARAFALGGAQNERR